jgi:UDP-N-acetylmuramyl tripeptide synthase
MLIAGIIGHDSRVQTANLISYILSSTGKKINVIDSKNLMELDSERFKNYLSELRKNGTDILVIKISVEDLSSVIFDDISIDILIYTEKTGDNNLVDGSNTGGHMKRVMSLLNEKSIAIVNIDDRELANLIKEAKNHIVSYGFNSKANMTTSSIGDAFICCLQRSISDKNGSLIEPQEYRVDIGTSTFDSHSLMAAVTFAILNGVNPNTINPNMINRRNIKW